MHTSKQFMEILFPQGDGVHLPFLMFGLHIMTSSQSTIYGKNKRRKVTVYKHDKYYVNQLNLDQGQKIVVKHVVCMYP